MKQYLFDSLLLFNKISASIIYLYKKIRLYVACFEASKENGKK